MPKRYRIKELADTLPNTQSSLEITSSQGIVPSEDVQQFSRVLDTTFRSPQKPKNARLKISFCLNVREADGIFYKLISPQSHVMELTFPISNLSHHSEVPIMKREVEYHVAVDIQNETQEEQIQRYEAFANPKNNIVVADRNNLVNGKPKLMLIKEKVHRTVSPSITVQYLICLQNKYRAVKQLAPS